MKGRVLASAAVCLSVAVPAAPAAAAARTELRCGWYENPTPANAWLVDRQAQWILGVQGGYQAGGADPPDMTTGGWVVTNGVSYGYGCGCVRGVFDHRRQRVVTIVSAESRLLRQCRADKGLPKPN